MNTLINDNVLYSCHLSKVGVMLGDFHLKADHVDIHPIVLSWAFNSQKGLTGSSAYIINKLFSKQVMRILKVIR